MKKTKFTPRQFTAIKKKHIEMVFLLSPFSTLTSPIQWLLLNSICFFSAHREYLELSVRCHSSSHKN